MVNIFMNQINKQISSEIPNQIPTALEFSLALMRQASITPQDMDCMALIVNALAPFGFSAHYLNFGEGQTEVKNLWLVKKANKNNIENLNGAFVFAGHTDVVPTGPLEKWHTPPFQPEIKDGLLYGRGAADMKTSIACFVTAVQHFLSKNPEHTHDIALLLTSDEEGPATHGTVKVVEWLSENKIPLAYCLVGEPSSENNLGDTIKYGRRGSMSGKLTIIGKQGHIAYPHLAKNAVHIGLRALDELVNHVWDAGNAFFPATSLQISNIHAGTGASNIIAGEMVVDFNIRFNDMQTVETLQMKILEILNKYRDQGVFEYDIKWVVSGQSFITKPQGSLFIAALQQAIRKNTRLDAKLSTAGGTSDGRFIAKICPQVLEFGVINASIHQINEHVKVSDLDILEKIYLDTMENLLR